MSSQDDYPPTWLPFTDLGLNPPSWRVCGQQQTAVAFFQL
jgi:hypothetical protein